MPTFWEAYFLAGLCLSALLTARRNFSDQVREFWAKRPLRSDTSKLVIMASSLALASALWIPLIAGAFVAGFVAGAIDHWRRGK